MPHVASHLVLLCSTRPSPRCPVMIDTSALHSPSEQLMAAARTRPAQMHEPDGMKHGSSNANTSNACSSLTRVIRFLKPESKIVRPGELQYAPCCNAHHQEMPPRSIPASTDLRAHKLRSMCSKAKPGKLPSHNVQQTGRGHRPCSETIWSSERAVRSRANMNRIS